MRDMPHNEEKTRQELINPKIHARGWTEDLIRPERTVGAVEIVTDRPRRGKGRVDYLLCLPVEAGRSPLPVAILEAKKENEFAALGIQQAQEYRRRFNVPFVFSSNGHLFTQWDEQTGMVIDNLPLERFPTPAELRARYEETKGYSLSDKEASTLFEQYKGGESARWYFQDAAIRAALEKIASGGNRVLLSLATGTGKTIIAAQLLHKLAQAGKVTKALFVCDRDELRTQGWSKMHAVFGDNAQIATSSDPATNARIVIASYQTLNISDEDREPRFWRENYPPNTFSHIIIDECHRSAWGKWSIILTDNPNAVQIGLTATPRIVVGGKKDDPNRKADEAITNHNLEYFGEPVYEYPMWMGQEDGYLAASEVIRRVVDRDQENITRADIEKRTATDPYTGQRVDPNQLQDTYTAKQYEEKLMLPDRVKAMCEDLFEHLLNTGGPLQKTIVFCVRDTHATMVRDEMNNLYQVWCKARNEWPVENFAFQCTGNPNLRPSAEALIPDFRGSKSSHFIATTVDLLSTGVDIPNLDNVVFFQYIQSPIEFYQRVGRGTRTGEPRGSKAMFRLYDYTNCTRLFGEEFTSRYKPTQPPGDDSGGGEVGGAETGTEGTGKPPTETKIIRVPGGQFAVKIDGVGESKGRSILCQEDGKDVLVPYEEYKQRLAARLVEEAPSVDALRSVWVAPDRRHGLLRGLPGGEAAVRLVRELENEQECDLFDVLSELGYGLPPKSRPERAAAFSYKNKQWLKDFPDRTSAVLVNMARQFEKNGIEELETPKVFEVEGVDFNALTGLPVKPDTLIQETKVRLLA